jgi:hypothetical protein
VNNPNPAFNTNPTRATKDPDPTGEPDTTPTGPARTVVEEFAQITAALALTPQTRAVAQGDVVVVPWPPLVAVMARYTQTLGVPDLGGRPVPILTGRGGHTHILQVVTGTARYWPAAKPGAQTLGVLQVCPDAQVLLGHEEHGDHLIGAGLYVIRRQRVHALATTTTRQARPAAPGEHDHTFLVVD